MNALRHTRSVYLLAGLLLCACGHDAKRTNPLDPELTPPVRLQAATDDTAGTVTLTWTQYEGEQPFGEYRVLRKVPGLEVVDTLAVIADISVTHSAPAGTFGGSRWQTFAQEDGLAGAVWSMYQSSDGLMWFGTIGSGVSRYDSMDQCDTGGE